MEREIKEIEAFEKDFEDGVYAIPMTTKVKVRALIDYCQNKGVSIELLSEEEIFQFVEKVEEREYE